MALLHRFDDPSIEQRFRVSERSARLHTSRALMLIGITAFLAYLFVNPFYFSREGLIAYNAGAGLFIAFLAAFLGLTRFRLMLENGWIDFLVFSGLAVAMGLVVDALATQQDVTGFSAIPLLVVNFGVLSVVASIGFVANTRLFLLWAAIVMAALSAALVSSDAALISKFYGFSTFLTFHAVAIFVNWDINRRARNVFTANEALAAEKAKTEELLYNVLPQQVAARLRAGEAVADAFADVSVIFVDIVGFSTLAKRLSPGHLVQTLNRFFLLADTCAERHGIEKVKTIGDAYLAVTGGTASSGGGAQAAIAFGRDLIAETQKLAGQEGVDIKLRIGIHSGPVVGGVVGSSRLAYDYWGDTMNIASRIEGVAAPNGIAVSAATYHQARPHFDFEAGETLTLKGVGDTEIYRVRL